MRRPGEGENSFDIDEINDTRFYVDIDKYVEARGRVFMGLFGKVEGENAFNLDDTRFYVDIDRFAVASRDIVVGDVLTVEKAIVSHMLPEYMVIIFSIVMMIIFLKI